MHASRTRTFGYLFMCAALLYGCGGGSTSSTPATPVAPPGPPVPVNLSIAVPRGPQSVRRAKYISPATQSIVASVTPKGGGPTVSATGNCAPSATACTVQVLAPVGVDVFTMTLYDGQNGTGNTLAIGTTTMEIVAGDTHDVLVTFNGVPASLAILATPSIVNRGTASTGQVTIIAYDSGGYIIVGPGAYQNPIALTSSDGSITFDAQSFTDPADSTTTYHYSGATANAALITLTASASGIASATTKISTLGGTPPPTGSPVPSPSISPAPSPSPSASPSPSPSASPSPSPSASATASGSPTASASPAASPTPSPTASPSPSPSPAPTPTTPPGLVLQCSYTVSAVGVVTTLPCPNGPISVRSGLPTTIDFNFTNALQGTLTASLAGQEGGALGWQVYTNAYNPVRITIGAQFAPGNATLIVRDAAGGYRTWSVRSTP